MNRLEEEFSAAKKTAAVEYRMDLLKTSRKRMLSWKRLKFNPSFKPITGQLERVEPENVKAFEGRTRWGFDF